MSEYHIQHPLPAASIKYFDLRRINHDTTGMRPATAIIHLDNLLHNYQVLTARANTAAVMAIVKANAYGHGLNLIAPALFDAGCRHFAVTDADEGKELRSYLADAESIVLLSGIFDASDALLCCEHSLTPVVTQALHIEQLQAAGFNGAIWLKINTGMQRLGADDPADLLKRCTKASIELAGIMSHLACADTPEHPLNQAQADEFTRVHESLAPQAPASLLNSAGLIALPSATHAFIRPGIALYGIEPVGTQPLGLKPVMQLTGQVMQVRQLTRGTSLSYGASYTAEEDTCIAIVSLGYGDGLPRRLSNRGHACIDGVALPIVGRICMDFCLLDCSAHPLSIGDSVEFWGEYQQAGDIAQSIDTIAYELFTGINTRVCRKVV